MIDKVKIIANYLPQYHEIQENNRWWGKGYTDWVAAKNAKPLFKGHYQPRVPLNDNYYDLSKVDSIKWQVALAKKYGIYGFGIYHYWFNSKMKLLEKPSEILLKNTDIDINFMFIWDNMSWVRTWKNIRFANHWVINNSEKRQKNDSGILANLEYGDKEDWRIHFEYLLDFFLDSRYIKIDRKPVFVVFNQNNGSAILKQMFAYWNELAKQHGFDGIFIIGKRNFQNINISDYEVTYEPITSMIHSDYIPIKIYEKIKTKINKILKRANILNDYDTVWRRILANALRNSNEKLFYSAFVDFDDTPRRGIDSRIILGSTPEKFEKYLSNLLEISKKQNKGFLFVTAWNEWGEGACLEPDKKYGERYLCALRNALVKTENI